MSGLPPGWEWTTLENVVDILDSRRVPVNATERARRPGSVPYYGATGQVGWIDDALFDEELVLLGEDGAPFLDPSKSKAYLIHGPSWVNNHAHVLRATRGATTNRFVKYMLDFADYRSHVNGTTRLKLTQKAMRAMRVPLPPRAEQERIVAAIEELLSRLDAAEASLRSAEARLETLESRVVDEAFQFLGQRVPVGEVAEVRGGIQKQPKRKPKDNPVPFLRVANVGHGWTNLDEVHEIEVFDGELERHRLEPGDLLVVEGNGSPDQIGRSAVWDGEIDPCVHQNHLIRVRPGPRLDPTFLGLYWNAPSTRAQLTAVSSSTSGLHTLSTAKVKRVEVPVASIERQQSVVDKLTAQIEVFGHLRDSLRVARVRQSSLRRSILAAAFSGRLVPQDPDDEPASVLLERIRAERAAAPPKKRTRKTKAT